MPWNAQTLGLLRTIKMRRGVRNLPDIIVGAAGQQPTAVMIARGDLALEIGFARLVKMQERSCGGPKLRKYWLFGRHKCWKDLWKPVYHSVANDYAFLLEAECAKPCCGGHLQIVETGRNLVPPTPSLCK